MLVRMPKKIHKRRLEATCNEEVKKVLIQVVLGVDLPEVWFKYLHYSLCCFVLFNVGDYLGRLAAEKIAWPGPGKVTN